MKDKTLKFCGPKFKLIYSVIQMLSFYLIIFFFPNYDILCILGISIIYLIPLYIDAYFIKFIDRETKLSQFYLADTVYYYLPSIALSLILEFLLYFVGKIEKNVGIYTVILFLSFTFLTLFQWLRFFIQHKMVKKSQN
jgi:drug/metabolite transporter (DMT)-like permease